MKRKEKNYNNFPKKKPKKKNNINQINIFLRHS